MKNYAGHRLSPWLAHLMVSRQETARPLLTPGEVMQLPPTDEVIMIAGLPPVRAKKIRYYEDRGFKGRVESPPALRGGGTYPDCPPARPDDWSDQVIAPPPALIIARPEDDEASEGGLRREPELPEHEDIAPEPVERNEFATLDDADGDDDALKARFLARQRLQTFTRAAAMDRDDEMLPGL